MWNIELPSNLRLNRSSYLLESIKNAHLDFLDGSGGSDRGFRFIIGHLELV
jgi:hypothetical protein